MREHSVTLATLHAEYGDWQTVRRTVLESNCLQARTQSTAQRVGREIISRLKRLTSKQLLLLIEGSSQDQGHILWAAACKRYRFIHEFAVEVVHEKFLRMDLLLTRADYTVFYNQKAEWHDEVSRIKESTRKKLCQVIFRMLHEAEMISANKMIIPVVLSPTVQAAIRDDPELSLAIYPV